MNPAVENPRALVLVGLVLVACGGGLSREEYSEAYGEALCHRQARCGEIRDEDACVSDAREFSRAYREGGLQAYFQYEGSIRAGRLRFDEEAAEACVQRLRDIPCDERLPLTRNGTICDVLEGLQQDGEPCVLTEECSEASYCERTGEAVCEVGTCKPRPGLDQKVAGAQECAPGLVRIGDTCRAPSGEGGACDSDSGCTARLYCEWIIRECRRFAVEGEACSEDGVRCLPHLRCGEGSCQRLSDVGMGCTPPLGGPSSSSDTGCKRDLFCEGEGWTPGTCRKRQGPGEPCSGSTCQGSLFCGALSQGSAWSCQPLRPPGESCASVPCAPGAYCDRGSETCLRQGRLGEPCIVSELFSCSSGLSCEDGTCEVDFEGLCEEPRG